MGIANQLNLSELSTKQITDLLWVLKGTPQAQYLYKELSSRNDNQPLVALDDPDWETKFNAILASQETNS
jgi:hypothetical protein